MLTMHRYLEQVFHLHAQLLAVVSSNAVQVRLAPHGTALEGRAPTRGQWHRFFGLPAAAPRAVWGHGLT